MRVLVWCSAASLGGGTKLFSGLVSALAREANIELVRVVLACSPQVKQDIRIAEGPNVEIVDFPQGNASIRVETARSLAQDCHVVYFFWPHQFEWMDLRRPTICTFHDTTTLDYVPPFASGLEIGPEFRRAAVWMSNATLVIAPSNHVASRIRSHFHLAQSNIKVIPHVSMPVTALAEDVVSQPLGGIPENYILYPANTSPHKNHTNLFLGYKRFSRHKEYPLILTGFLTDTLRKAPPDWSNISFIPWLQSIIQDVGFQIDRELHPLGFVSNTQMRGLIQSAKALIVPSISEGGGSYPVEEALQLGTPVLCSDIPVLREQMASHTAEVMWFDPWSPESIARGLDELIRDYPKYKQSAMKGRGDTRMSWDELARLYSAAFSEAYLRAYRSPN